MIYIYLQNIMKNSILTPRHSTFEMKISKQKILCILMGIIIEKHWKVCWFDVFYVVGSYLYICLLVLLYLAVSQVV